MEFVCFPSSKTLLNNFSCFFFVNECYLCARLISNFATVFITVNDGMLSPCNAVVD